MKTLAIVGAGCSNGLAGLPTDRSFMKDVYAQKSRFHFLGEALDCLYPSPFSPITIISDPSWSCERLEVCWNEIEENRRHTKIILKSSVIDYWFTELIELARQEVNYEYKWYSRFLGADHMSRSHYEYFFMFTDWEMREAVVDEFSAILNEEKREKYQKLLAKLQDLAGHGEILNYVILNYDTLIEQTLDNDWYYAGLPENLNGRSEKEIKVIKPHGSVNWLDNHGQSISTRPPDRPIPLNEIGYKDNFLYRHSIVPLVGRKEVYEAGFASFGDFPPLYYIYDPQIMNELSRVIREAEQVIIIGYSFPVTDGHLRGKIVAEDSQSPKKIVLVDKEQDIRRRHQLQEKVGYIFANAKIDCYWDGVENWICR